MKRPLIAVVAAALMLTGCASAGDPTVSDHTQLPTVPQCVTTPTEVLAWIDENQQWMTGTARTGDGATWSDAPLFVTAVPVSGGTKVYAWVGRDDGSVKEIAPIRSGWLESGGGDDPYYTGGMPLSEEDYAAALDCLEEA